MPEEGEVKDGKHYVAGRWRTTDEIYRMAVYSVSAAVAKQPRTLKSVSRVTGLAEINAKRALNTGIEDGVFSKFSKDGETLYQCIDISEE